MQIENDFLVPAGIDAAWGLLTDIPAIAPCLPGAELTGQDGDEYQGTMKVKVGPITTEYQGVARVIEQNTDTRTVVLEASGRDKRGAGTAAADITAVMSEEADGTRVAITTELKITGKVAQFGRGVMNDISKKLLGQFADCIEGKLAATSTTTDEPTGTAAAAGTARPAEPAFETPGPAAGDDDALDLLDVAGPAMAKRLIPVIAAIVVVVILVLLVT